MFYHFNLPNQSLFLRMDSESAFYQIHQDMSCHKELLSCVNRVALSFHARLAVHSVFVSQHGLPNTS